LKNRIQVNLNLKQVKKVTYLSQFFNCENAIFFGLNKVPRYKFAILIVMFLMALPEIYVISEHH
jgi:hypothetical protein